MTTESYLVYRVEHADKSIGPFNFNCWDLDDDSDVFELARLCRSCNSTEHPTAKQDGLAELVWAYDEKEGREKHSKDWRYACLDTETLGHWFQSEFRAFLTKIRFIVHVYRVSGFIPGTSGKQVVFHSDDAELVDAFPLTALD